MPLISLSVTSTYRTTKRNMKYDPTRKSSHPDEAEILSPIEGNDKVQYLNDRLDYQKAVKEMCELHKPIASGGYMMSPVYINFDQPKLQASSNAGSDLIASWDDLVRNGVGLGDGVGAPAAMEPDEVVQGNKEEEDIKTWQDLVQGEAVLGENGGAKLDMKVKERLWSTF